MIFSERHPRLRARRRSRVFRKRASRGGRQRPRQHAEEQRRTTPQASHSTAPHQGRTPQHAARRQALRAENCWRACWRPGRRCRPPRPLRKVPGQWSARPRRLPLRPSSNGRPETPAAVQRSSRSLLLPWRRRSWGTAVPGNRNPWPLQCPGRRGTPGCPPVRHSGPDAARCCGRRRRAARVPRRDDSPA
ncbi:hypothetical protein D9M72_516320 [compost metagenome]